jgi:2-iminobutanoate/2-iminopropanoate deaminase
MRLVQLFGPDRGRLKPLGIRFGHTVYATNLNGGEDGMEAALSSMRAVLDEAGATLDNVARVTAYVPGVAERDPVYGPWDALFPDSRDRPAFKVLVAGLPDGVTVRLDMLAQVDARRRRVDIPGVPARDPAIQIGNWALTSRVHGTDPATGKVAVGGLEVESRQALKNIDQLVDLAGVPPRMSQLTGFVRGRDLAANAVLTRVADGRPLTVLTAFVPQSMQLMLEAIAGEPGVREVFASASGSADQKTPIPEAICIGDLFFAPSLTAEHTDSFEAELRSALSSMQTCLATAGLSLGNVAHVTVYMPDLSLRPTLNDVWAEWFPNPADRPPHKYVPGDQVQLQVFAIRDSSRQALEIPGLVHGDPMSMGVRIGDLLFSSRVVGTDPVSGKTPPEPESQATIALDNVRTLLSQGGATPHDLSQVTAFITGDRDRQAVLAAWDAMFAGTATRPTLKFLQANLTGTSTVRLEIIASIPDGGSAC